MNKRLQSHLAKLAAVALFFVLFLTACTEAAGGAASSSATSSASKTGRPSTIKTSLTPEEVGAIILQQPALILPKAGAPLTVTDINMLRRQALTFGAPRLRTDLYNFDQNSREFPLPVQAFQIIARENLRRHYEGEEAVEQWVDTSMAMFKGGYPADLVEKTLQLFYNANPFIVRASAGSFFNEKTQTYYPLDMSTLPYQGFVPYEAVWARGGGLVIFYSNADAKDNLADFRVAEIALRRDGSWFFSASYRNEQKSG